jgi:hypothetical protein
MIPTAPTKTAEKNDDKTPTEMLKVPGKTPPQHRKL